MTEKAPLYVVGMHGMGDNIHQRAILKNLTASREIWLETSWPQIYWDMPELHLVNKGTNLRTQLKNSAAHAAVFDRKPMPQNPRPECLRIFYKVENVIKAGSILGGMLDLIQMKLPQPDYALPIRADWAAKADALIARLKPTKPILLYRPLIERREWDGCAARNPDHAAYAELVSAIREDYYVVSIADLAAGKEWAVGSDIKADAEFHAGELDFETVAGLCARASLVYGSPGFVVVLGRSLQVPTVCVFGGYEDSRSFTLGAGAYLGIDTIRPCMCFQHHHGCTKTIDIPTATTKIKDFSREAFATRDNRARSN